MAIANGNRESGTETSFGKPRKNIGYGERVSPDPPGNTV